MRGWNIITALLLVIVLAFGAFVVVDKIKTDRGEVDVVDLPPWQPLKIIVDNSSDDNEDDDGEIVTEDTETAEKEDNLETFEDDEEIPAEFEGDAEMYHMQRRESEKNTFPNNLK